MKTMKYMIVLTGMAPLLWSSCDQDGNLDVDVHDPNVFFEPEQGATDEESLLRRDFQERYGSYLLFNDTLQHVYQGTNVNGDAVYWTELLSLDYTVGQTAYAGNNYSYSYIPDYEGMKEGVDFLEKYILSHIGGSLMPYSWFLCNQINYRATATSAESHPYAAAGQRSIVLATGMLKRLKTEAQINKYVNSIFVTILPYLAANRIDAFKEFAAISKGYYQVALNGTPEERKHVARQHGFLDESSMSWGAITPGEDIDLAVYCTYSLTYTDEQIERMYADYPLVLKKWQLLKDAMARIGFTY